MHVRASSLLLWFCSSTFALSHVIPHGRRSFDDDEYTGNDDLVQTWSDSDDSTSVRFASLCDNCFGSIDISYIFEIRISSTQFACGETNVTLNHRGLDLVWHGDNGIGSGIFPANMTSGYQTHELSLNYLGFCISSPQGVGAQYTAQILTVTFQPTNQITDNDRTSGFAVSFNSVGAPRIYHLVASPIEISDENAFDSWVDPLDPFNLPISTDKTASSDYILYDDLKTLHSLKAQAQELQEKIKSKEQEIRKHLLQDCKSMAMRLKECTSLSCFIRTSFEIVPDAFRLVKHQFGPLPSSLSGSPCRPPPDASYQAPSSQDTGSPSNNLNPNALSTPQSTPSPNPSSSTSTPQSTTIPTHLTNSPPSNYYDDLPNCHDQHPPNQNFPPKCRHVLHGHNIPNSHDISVRNPSILLKDLAIILLIASLFVVLIKHCRNSPSWLRRRVDIATRREERRTRNAYLNAARRYRWRQWWNNRFGRGRGREVEASRHSQQGRQQERNMLIRVNEECGNGGGNSSNMTAVREEGATGAGEGGGEAIQAEILGFRRVLEFVGELVRPDYMHFNYDDDNNNRSSDNSRRRGTGNQGTGSYQSDISQLPYPATAPGVGVGRSSTPAPSSVAPLTTTIYSPRTSTVLSIETDSSLTLDSLDPETATMFSG
ncbi:hypothetical protein BDBG_05679 [Blastomyces gilchristii SLH14081]|uniref:Uncharacterized protein n=1 Tax=Blastomyces gilchristii (strain SLH14081) TaxID=559298 RepID=A0A179UPI9_BLAGS|nr:uncharacterized protein BDBG_05679 [Blastomyces gilchristii SLH14081]OAT09995.1 hypothetical protein BDBG_05679 [Blastomyces gilchristii SLH14081]